MPFGRKARHVKAYQFGAEAPLEGVGAVLEQHRLRTDYYNALVEMELRQREWPRWGNPEWQPVPELA